MNTTQDNLSIDQARTILLALCGAVGTDKIDIVIEGLSDDIYDLGVEGDAGLDLPRLVCALAKVAEWGENDIPEIAISGMLRDLPWPTRRLTAKVRNAEELALALRAAFKPFGSLDYLDVEQQAKLVLAWLDGDFSAAHGLLNGPSSAATSQWSRASIGLTHVQWITPTSGTPITCTRLTSNLVEVEVDFGHGGSVSRAQTIENAADELGLDLEETLV